MKRNFVLLVLQFFVFEAFSQFVLKGIVTGSGEPLAGASVVLKNSTYGMSASPAGEYEFRNLARGEYTLNISFVGFEPREIPVVITSDMKMNIDLKPGNVLTDEVLVQATRVKENSPLTWSSVSKEEIAIRNKGQDIPYLLQLTPSFVSTSDAGAGIGYSSFRIRGADMNRINVMINGIPLNDAESHGTWFIDLPDLASSLENVQVQRGVGTSASGAASFGATINLQTSTMNSEPYATYKGSLGSYSTLKSTISAGTGLLANRITFDARLSSIHSDGYIDRAFSDLKSWFVSGGFHSANNILKINAFAGNEYTYQAWNGIPSDMLNTNRRYNPSGYYMDEAGKEMFYEDETDRYGQEHFQALFSHKISSTAFLNLALHYTHGKGNYENLKTGKKFADYRLPDFTAGNQSIKKTDLVAQKWLDNDFYGFTWSFNLRKNKIEFTPGGGFNHYTGNHFGKVIWAKYLNSFQLNHEWYRNKGNKTDINIFGKLSYQVTEKVNLMADLQYRFIDYEINGSDDDLRDIGQNHIFHFFNPKGGVFARLNPKTDIYSSLSVANREPNRDNFVDADPKGKQPRHETLFDWETGFSHKSQNMNVTANLFYMDYRHQLVLTGEINDVGAPIMVNVDKSYRTGLELQLGYILNRRLQWNGNATFSRNIITDFTEYVDNWDTWEQEAYALGKTDLAYSPNFMFNSRLRWLPAKGIQTEFVSSYVGKQYIDNTSNSDRMLNAWFVNHLIFSYSFKTKYIKNINLNFTVNNLFNAEYESNAWVYSYISEGKRQKMDGYFPQAGRHYYTGIEINF